MTAKLARVLFIILLVIPGVRAQSASREAEQKKAREERERKTLELVDEIIREAQSLKLPENRIRIDVALADSLWPRDEKRARARFQDAVAALSEITAAVDSAEQDYYLQSQLPQQLRQEILQVAINHDLRLAVDFLRASRPADPGYGAPRTFEAQLEMRLAVQLAVKDPQEALSLAEESLRVSIDNDAINLLNSLQSRDKAAAEKLLGIIMNRVRTDDFSKSPAAMNITVNLLRAWIEGNRPADHPGKQMVVNLSLSNIDEQTARELSNIVIREVINSAAVRSGAPPVTRVMAGGGLVGYNESFHSYPGQLIGILQQLKPMLPDLERLAPNQLAALRESIAGLDRLRQAQDGPWVKYQELGQNGTVREILAAAKGAPPDVENYLVQQAAWKAFNGGDTNGAREIAEKIADPRQRREMALSLDRQSFYRASEQNKLAEARALLSRLPSLEERSGILCQLAASAATTGDKAAALQLLAEAHGLVGGRAQSYPQLQAQIQIAGAYEELDAGKSAAIVEGVIDQVNELSIAALVLNGFDIQQYFRSGEFIINGNNALNTIAREAAQRLGSISRKQYDRARLMAERFQRPEMRVMGLIRIVETALSADDQ